MGIGLCSLHKKKVLLFNQRPSHTATQYQHLVSEDFESVIGNSIIHANKPGVPNSVSRYQFFVYLTNMGNQGRFFY